MVKVGIAGIGFMGVTHYKAWQSVPGAEVKAIFTRSAKKLAGDWSSIQGNFGDSGGTQDLSGIATYEDFGDLIADDSLDLIDICLPTNKHPEATVRALDAGRHVLVEKPIAIATADANEMIAVARDRDRLLMVAQVLRFWPEWLWLKQAVDSGEFGALRGLNLRRVISMPDWSRSVQDLAANGGPMIDLHIHDVDFLCYLLGKPKRVFSQGQTTEGLVSYISTVYDYGSDLTVSAQSGAITMKGRQFHHSYEAYFEKATIAHSVATEPAGTDAAKNQQGSQVLTAYHADGSVTFPEPPATEAFEAQLAHAAECVERGERSPIIDAEIARDSLSVVHDENRSAIEGKVIDVS